MSLTRDQELAVAMAMENPISVITGGPGVGKTHVVKNVVECMPTEKTALLAPTGKAARRLAEMTGAPASTIHSFLWRQEKRNEADEADEEYDEDTSVEGPENIIIDESSMVSVTLLARLMKAWTPTRDRRLVFVGDPHQLPAIGPGAILRDMISSQSVPCVELTEIMRQGSGSRIVHRASEIHQGVVSQEFFYPAVAEFKNDWQFVDLGNRDVKEAGPGIRNWIGDVLKSSRDNDGLDLIQDVQVLSPEHRGGLGVTELNRSIQARINPPDSAKTELAVERRAGGFVFREGDKVICTRNMRGHGLVNGDLGRVMRCNQKDQTMLVFFPQYEMSIEIAGHVLDEFKLAWAMTVHKSQGSEYERVILVLHSSMYFGCQRPILYTAITRAIKAILIVGNRKAIHMAAHNNRSHARITRMRDHLQSGAQS